MNAIILAAGTSSRFVPLSIDKPKGLLEVKGEILIERQIKQLKDAGIDDITIVTGYKAEQFDYLKEKMGVATVFNEDYDRYNNSSSIIRVVDRLSDTFLCCSDHYFSINVFEEKPSESYYAALFAEGDTKEYCLVNDQNDYIKDVTVGGHDSWYMAGHCFFTDSFSRKFREILLKEWPNEQTRKGYWEDLYIRYIDVLPMKVKRYTDEDIFEFDTLDELRLFDSSYLKDSRSSILKNVCNRMDWEENELHDFRKVIFSEEEAVFSLLHNEEPYMITCRNETINISEL